MCGLCKPSTELSDALHGQLGHRRCACRQQSQFDICGLGPTWQMVEAPAAAMSCLAGTTSCHLHRPSLPMRLMRVKMGEL